MTVAYERARVSAVIVKILTYYLYLCFLFYALKCKSLTCDADATYPRPEYLICLKSKISFRPMQDVKTLQLKQSKKSQLLSN